MISTPLLGLPWFWLSYSSSSFASPGHSEGQVGGELFWTPAWESFSPFGVYLYRPAGPRQALCAIFSPETGAVPSPLRKNGPGVVGSQRPQTGRTEGKLRVTDFCGLSNQFLPFLGRFFWFSFLYHRCWDRSKPKWCKRTAHKVRFLSLFIL